MGGCLYGHPPARFTKATENTRENQPISDAHGDSVATTQARTKLKNHCTLFTQSGAIGNSTVTQTMIIVTSCSHITVTRNT